MESIEHLLQGSLQRHRLGEHYTASTILATCRALIEKKMPLAAAKAIIPSAFQHGVVFLRAGSSIAAQEFHFYEQDILTDLRVAHPKDGIRTFAFRLQTSLDRDGDEVAL